MERKNQQSGGNGGGFLLGVIVGVLITLLFTTKRGREIFKDVLEHGVEKFSNLEDLMREVQEKEAVEPEENDFVPTQPVPPAVVAEQKKAEVKKPEAAPAPAVPRKEIKTEATQAISPHVVESVPVVQKVEEVKEEPKPEPKTETPPKSSTGKRWFRGLRKRS